MDGNGMRAAHVEARQEPGCPARLRLIQRVVCGSLAHQGRAYARWHIGCFATKAATSNTVKWFPWAQGRVSIAGHPAAAHSGVSTLRAPCQDTHS